MSIRERELGVNRASDEEATTAAPSEAGAPRVATAEVEAPVAPPAPVVTVQSSRAELTGGTTVGEYQIEGRLGSGAFGTVYGAIQPLIGKRVAIKVLDMVHSVDPGMVSRFVAEARAVNVIGHENIVDIFSFGELDDGRRYFVMERLDGKPLSALLKEQGPLPPAEALSILAPVAHALAAAHAAGIAHRDLKPDNIFLCTAAGGGWRPKLLDFGVAKLLDETTDQHATATGVTVGTPSYMSPEQCVGKGVDHRADIYAFGVLTHRMLAGRLPFHAESGSEMMARHLYEKPTPLRDVRPELPHAITEAVLAMLDKDKARRPQSVEEALAALERAMAGDAPTPHLRPRRAPGIASSSEPGAATDVRTPTADMGALAGRSKRGVVLAVGAVVLALAASAVVLGRSRSTTTASTPSPATPSATAAAVPTNAAPAAPALAAPVATPTVPAAAPTNPVAAAPGTAPSAIPETAKPATELHGPANGPTAMGKPVVARLRRGGNSAPPASPAGAAAASSPATSKSTASPPAVPKATTAPTGKPGDSLPGWDGK